MESFGKRSIRKRNRSLRLRKYSTHSVMRLMPSEHFEKLCSCVHSEIIRISYSCTAYTGRPTSELMPFHGNRILLIIVLFLEQVTTWISICRSNTWKVICIMLYGVAQF